MNDNPSTSLAQFHPVHRAAKGFSIFDALSAACMTFFRSVGQDPAVIYLSSDKGAEFAGENGIPWQPEDLANAPIDQLLFPSTAAGPIGFRGCLVVIDRRLPAGTIQPSASLPQDDDV